MIVQCAGCYKRLKENNELWLIFKPGSSTKDVIFVLACRECREILKPIEKFPNSDIDWETGQSIELLHKKFFSKE